MPTIPRRQKIIFLLPALLLLLFSCSMLLADPSDPAPESTAQFDARMAWWRDAKFGLFIHWDPVSLVGQELSWSRAGAKPLDITGSPAGPVEDPVYDNLYKQFDPEKFDAKQWVRIAQDAGMKYIVLTCKHHDGFSMFHTALSNYSIAQTPFKRDVVKELADACHAAGMRFGVYYSPRDWHQPDYGIGDNRKYVDYMNGQLRELLTNYGPVDIIWFDSYGRGDLVNFWRIGETWSLIKSLQPAAVVNNRLSILGANDQQPAPYRGDTDTPEQTIGRMQTTRPWESCMCLVGHQWSYKPGGEMQTFPEVLRDLVSCVAGDGNLLLDVGPMPTGEIEPRQVDRLKEVGDWLKQYGASIYGTRGGPYVNGLWGGSTYRGSTVYLHVLLWDGDTLHLGPLEGTIVATRVLTGGDAKVFQSDKGLDLTLANSAQAPVDTIIELTLDRPVSPIPH